MMIHINLRPGARRGRAAPKFSFNLEALKGLVARFKDPLPALVMVSWIGAIGFLGWTWVSSSSRLGDLTPRLEEARSEHARFQDFLEQKRSEEATRDSVVAQIETIRAVDRARFVWPHILDEVSRALPGFTWLVDVSGLPPATLDSLGAGPPPVEFQITGRTVDIQGYTRFMRQLEESPWLGQVMTVSANTVVEQGRAVTAFVLRAVYTQADSSQIRMVPVAESVVR
jgi:Tfp pilus assembly protein PilN